MPAEAVKRAGYALNTGMEAKLERRRDVQARIAYLRREDDELIRRKREEIEAALLAVLTVDVTQFAKIDEDGTITGWDWNRIRGSGWSQMLCEIGPDGGPKIKLADKLNALAQLRDPAAPCTSTPI